MLNPERAIITTNNDQNLHDHHQRDHEEDDDQEPVIRDIHALTPPQPPPPRARRREAWETGSHRSSSLSISSEVASTSTENFTTMSREFNALVLAGSAIDTNNDVNDFNNNNNNNNNTVNGNNNYNSNVNYNNNSLLARIREDHHEVPEEETNPLAIVPDNNPYDLGGSESRRVRLGGDHSGGVSGGSSGGGDEICVERVKKEEVESKISAWQNAKVSKINNRYKREEAVINGWENEQVQKAGSWMKKVERKLEEKRARALEKMQNDVAKARRKAEDKRSSAEAKRGTKIAGILEIANLMRAVGRPPAKRSFFK